MGSKTGLAAQVGVGVESVWGTRVAPTRYLEILSEGISLQTSRAESGGLRAGRRFARKWRENRKGASGPVAIEVPTKGFGLICKHILGSIAAPTTPVGGTLSRDHLATPGDQDGKSLTVQVGRPDLGGVVRPFDYTGGKIMSAEFSNSVDGFLQCTLNFDFQNEDTSQTLGTASYPTGLEQFFFVDAVLKIDGVALDVKDLSFMLGNGLKADRYYLRGSSLKKEQIEDTAPREGSGSFNADFEGLTLYNKFINGTEAVLSGLWRHPVPIEGSIYPEFEVIFNRIRFDGSTPNVQGSDVLNQAVPFKVFEPLSGGSPTASLRVRSDDVAP